MNLDNLEEYQKFDQGKVLDSIKLLADQIEQGWYEASGGNVPQSCTLAKQVVICGMGGSALGGRIVNSLFPSSMRTPIEVVTEYEVPNYVGPGTLVIVSSYSGNTEETINAAYEARQKNAQIYGITTGGKLEEFLKRYNYPGYVFEAKSNPSGQPRLALGYSVAAIMAVLAKCDFISMTNEEMDQAIKVARKVLSDNAPDKEKVDNLAKGVAMELKGKMPVLVASEHLVGAVHAFKNQLNEGAKTFAVLFDLPELNHHLMEGLRNPAEIKEKLIFLLLKSELYSERVKARYPITEKVIEQNEAKCIGCEVAAESRLDQVFEVMAFGSMVHYYLAMLYEIDPSPIPWVDFFKKELAKV